MTESRWTGKRLFWLLHSLGWLMFWGLELFIYSKRSMTGLDVFMFSLTHILGYLTTLALPFIYRRLYNRIKPVIRLISWVLITSLLTAFVWFYTDAFISYLITPTKQFLDYYINIPLIDAIRHFSYRTIPIIAWSALYFGIRFWFELSSEKKKAEEALFISQQAQMQMLRYQLNPHFIFNSLSTIRALVDEDPRTAKEMITALSEFFRHTIMQEDRLFRPVEKETEVLKHYFSIEKKGFGEKLEVHFDIDSDAAKALLPSFLLQPLAENAIKYGMQTSPPPLKITISAATEDQMLKLNISNTGKWVNADPESGNSNLKNYGMGNGLDNVRQRLENAYGKNFRFSITTNGVSVSIGIEIPMRYDEF